MLRWFGWIEVSVRVHIRLVIKCFMFCKITPGGQRMFMDVRICPTKSWQVGAIQRRPSCVEKIMRKNNEDSETVGGSGSDGNAEGSFYSRHMASIDYPPMWLSPGSITVFWKSLFFPPVRVVAASMSPHVTRTGIGSGVRVLDVVVLSVAPGEQAQMSKGNETGMLGGGQGGGKRLN